MGRRLYQSADQQTANWKKRYHLNQGFPPETWAGDRRTAGRTDARGSPNEEFGLDEPPADILWNWQDLYENVCAFCEARPLRPIEPPDHRLILNRLLRELLKEEPELLSLWPGLGRTGFLDILSEDIRELINEAVLPEQAEFGLSQDDRTARILPRLYRNYLEK